MFLSVDRIKQLPEVFLQSNEAIAISEEIGRYSHPAAQLSLEEPRSIRTVSLKETGILHGIYLSVCFWWMEFTVLSYRIMLRYWRDLPSTIGDLLQKIGIGLVVGYFFWQLGTESTVDVLNRVGLLFWNCLAITIALHDVLVTFPDRKALFNKEVANGMYSPSAYYMAQNLVDIPFQQVFNSITFLIVFWMAGLNVNHFWSYMLISNLLVYAGVGVMLLVSAVSRSFVHATLGATLLNMFFVLTGGFFTTENKLSDGVSWIKWLSFIRWSFASYMINEFQDLEYLLFTGKEVLANYSFLDETLSFTLPYLFFLGTLYRIGGFFLFKHTHRRVGLDF